MFFILFLLVGNWTLQTSPPLPLPKNSTIFYIHLPLLLFKLIIKFHNLFHFDCLENMQRFKIDLSQNSQFVYRYCGYLKLYQIGSIFKICICISAFRSKKNHFVDLLHTLQVKTILMIQANLEFFFKHPVYCYKTYLSSFLLGVPLVVAI